MADEPKFVTFTYKGKEYKYRRPDLGNIDEISFQRVNRRSRGGDIIIFRDDDWPKTETLNLNFTFVNEKDGIDLLQFIKLSLGDLVTYKDHENRVWEGVIQNPTAELIQTGPSIWTLNMVFEGGQV